MFISVIEDFLSSLGSESGHSFSFTANSATESLRLSIRDVGEIKFPVNITTIKKLIKTAKPALFGHKEKTLYDPEIRNTWELAKSRVKIDMNLWTKELAPILDKMSKELFPEETLLKAQLHNMLIYEPGQFFKKHQDTEKTDDMQATLVVILPTKEAHRGGNLSVEHAGKKKVYGKKRGDGLIQFVGFYADCVHQVSKVIDGHRLVLTFNISVKSKGKTLDEAHPKLTEAMNSFFADPLKVRFSSVEEKSIFCALSHQYTPRNLTWDKLKGSDVHPALALKAGAEELGLKVYLGNFEYRATYDAESGDDDFDQYSYSDEECEECDESDYSIGELIDDSWKWLGCVDANGRAIGKVDLDLYCSEKIDLGNISDLEIKEEEYEGYMGNYGNTVDRIYHRAGILIRNPKAELFKDTILSPMKELKRISCLPEKEAIEQVTRLFPYVESFPLEKDVLELAVDIGIKLKSSDIFQKIVSDRHRFLLFELPAKSLIKFDYLDKHMIDGMIKQELKVSYQKNWLAITLLKSCVKDSNFCKRFSYIMPYLLDETTKKIRHEYSFDRNHHLNRVDLAVMAIDFSLKAKCFSKVRPLLKHIEKHPRSHPAELLVSRFPPTRERLQVRELEGFYLNCLHHLNSLAGPQPLQTDISIPSEEFCSCGKCKELRLFLGSKRTHIRLQLFKKDQNHILSVIRDHIIPVKYKFGLESSRYYVEYTKNLKVSFETRLNSYKASKKALEKLNDLTQSVSS